MRVVALHFRTTIKPLLRAVRAGIPMAMTKKERLLKKEALEYHEAEPRGKIKVVPTKPHSTAHELSLAYSPGPIPVWKSRSVRTTHIDTPRKVIWSLWSPTARLFSALETSVLWQANPSWKARDCC
jgi:hypothetical protein